MLKILLFHCPTWALFEKQHADTWNRTSCWAHVSSSIHERKRLVPVSSKLFCKCPKKISTDFPEHERCNLVLFTFQAAVKDMCCHEMVYIVTARCPGISRVLSNLCTTVLHVLSLSLGNSISLNRIRDDTGADKIFQSANVYFEHHFPVPVMIHLTKSYHMFPNSQAARLSQIHIVKSKHYLAKNLEMAYSWMVWCIWAATKVTVRNTYGLLASSWMGYRMYLPGLTIPRWCWHIQALPNPIIVKAKAFYTTSQLWTWNKTKNVALAVE